MAVPRTPLSLALVVVASFTLAACTTSGSSSAGSAASDAAGGGGAAVRAPAAGSAADAAAAPARPGSGAAPPAVVKQRVIRTAQVVVRVDGELAPAAAKVRAVAQGLGGSVSSETTTFADAGDPGTTVDGSTPSSTSGDASSSPAAPAAGKAAHPGQSLLVLRVPESSIDKALTLISGPGGVGKELSRAATAQDVTGDLADLQSRVATQRASVARIRALLGKAGSLRDVVLLESEVTKREADLEALEARQAALADRADMATLTVDLRTAEAAVTVAQAEPPNAFLDGLHSGWKALTASLTVILTILGALLPLAILAAILGAPALWVLRRRRRTPVRPVPPTPAPTAGAGS